MGKYVQGTEYIADVTETLEITDPEQFAAALARGIGAKQTYGQGPILLKSMFNT